MDRKERGSSAFGWLMRWWAVRVVPPSIGATALGDMLLIRRELFDWPRVVVCLILIGHVKADKALEWLTRNR